MHEPRYVNGNIKMQKAVIGSNEKKSMFKPIFYQKLRSCWVVNTNEFVTNNMKSTWPTRTQGLLGIALGVKGFALGPQGFSETNMVVLALQKSPLGVLPNARPKSKGVCIVVEYRLYSLESKSIKIPLFNNNSDSLYICTTLNKRIALPSFKAHIHLPHLPLVDSIIQ